MKRILVSIILIIVQFHMYANDIENKFLKAGLIDISTIDSTIKIDLVNSNANKNYFRRNFYDGLEKCYLQKDIALKVVKAQKILKKYNNRYSILIMDGARPREISHKMYEQLKSTPFKKYVANPETGSMHNYGAAVDVTIVDENGKELDMGPSPFYKNNLELIIVVSQLKLGKLTKKQNENRILLKKIMQQAELKPIKLEWWHFEGYSIKEIRKRYKIIE